MMKDIIEILLKQARENPTPEVIEELIEFEVDYNGVWVGFAMSQYLWHRLFPMAA